MPPLRTDKYLSITPCDGSSPVRSVVALIGSPEAVRGRRGPGEVPVWPGS